MKIRRITKLLVGSVTFTVIWDKKITGGSFDYVKKTLVIGLMDNDNSEQLTIICHELMEMVATEMYVRHSRNDCGSDYIFVYDHRQHTTMAYMFSGLLQQFII